MPGSTSRAARAGTRSGAPLSARQRAEDGCDLGLLRGGNPDAASAAPVMTVPFWAPSSLIQNSTSRGFVELYDDRVAFDFEVVSTWGPRSLRAVHIPLDRVRSVEFTHSWVKGKFVQMRVEHGPWTVQLPFVGGTVWFAVGSKEEGEGFVAAMRERLGKSNPPAAPGA